MTWTRCSIKAWHATCLGRASKNVKWRINVRIVTTPKELRRLVNKPSFQAIRVFNLNMAAVKLYRTNEKLNKRIAVGYTVLESEKMKMYHLWYEVLLGTAFSDFNISLLMSNTDSFLVHIENDPAKEAASVDAALRKHRYEFDMSDGPPLKNDCNRQVYSSKWKCYEENESCPCLEVRQWLLR